MKAVSPEGNSEPAIKVGNRKRVYDNLVFSCVCAYDFRAGYLIFFFFFFFFLFFFYMIFIDPLGKISPHAYDNNNDG